MRRHKKYRHMHATSHRNESKLKSTTSLSIDVYLLYAERGRLGLSSSLVVLLVLPFDLIDLEPEALTGFLRGDRGDLLDLVLLLFFFVLFVSLADESSENLEKPVGSDDAMVAAKRKSV